MNVNLSPDHPLTLAQLDIYFHQLHQPQSAMYNVGGYLVLNQVAPQTIEHAHRQVILHHDAFGIRIHTSETGVFQSISSERNTVLAKRDFSMLPDPETSAKQWLADLFQQPFQLYETELYKTFLVKVGPSTHWYVGVVHHLMMDGWGFTNWARELQRQFSQPLSEAQAIPPSWAEIIAEDHAYSQSEKFQRDRAYWQKELPYVPEKLLEPHYRADFPTNKPVPSMRETMLLPSASMQTLETFSQDHQISLPTLFLTLLTSYFAREKHRDQIVVGLPVHNRRGRKQKRMLGVFTGISPLVVQCHKGSTILDLAQQIQSGMKKHFRHQRYPIGRLARDLGIAGGDQRLYDVCYNFLKLDSPFEVEGSSSLHYLSNSQEPTPLTLTLWQVGSEDPIEMQAEFNRAYFQREEIRLLLERLVFLLDQLEENPQITLGHLHLVPPKEQALIQGWQGEAISFDKTTCVHQLFEAQAAAKPNQIALYHDQVTLTYASLNHQANQLAQDLRRQGLQPQNLVGLYLSRGPAMIIAMLGAMKAGVPYVPLDPKYPESRLRAMLEAGQIRLVLTEAGLQERIEKEGVATYLVSDNKTPDALATANNQALAPMGTSHHAYVLFTSGSTGRPKGVAISHANVSAMIHWAQTVFSSEELERVLISTSLNFDISVFEIFLPLCTGHSCVIVENALTLLEKKSLPPISLINTVPSAIRALLEQDAVPASVKVVNLAGEALPQDTVNQLLRQVPKVYNLYGPTEDTTYSTYACFESPLTNTPVIGRPIGNSQAHVLGPDGRSLPIGAIGELHLGGFGVTRGYLNQTRETASRFIPYPHQNGKRLYRTGDLVRWLPHGQLQFLGRFDDQIKLRGFRIELQEIVAQLLNHDDVKDAAVVVRGPSNKQMLVAYVVAMAEPPCQEAYIESLRLCLRESLPEYMVPAAFVPMDKLPLTPNGKINRAKLPSPEREHLIVTAQAAQPRNSAERQLQEVWQEVLQTSPVGIHDNFFELGGDSILAIQIMTQAHKRGLHLAPGDLFSNPSIAALAEVATLEKRQIAGTIPEKGPVTPLPIQQWFLESGMAEPNHFNQSVLLEIDVRIDASMIQKALDQLHQHHDALRLRFSIGGLEPIHYAENASAHFEVHPTPSQESIAAFILSQTNQLQRHLDLQQGPLLAAALFHTDNQTANLLFIAIHHLVTDGVSWRILLEDFTTLLNAEDKGQVATLPDKTTSLSAWSAKLRQSSGALDYWQHWPQTVLPASFRSLLGEGNHFDNLFAGNTETLTLRLDQGFTADLIKHPAAIYRLGVQEVMLAALGRALAAGTDRWDMMFDLESHGREQGLFEDMDLSRTMGWFTSIFPFRLVLQPKGEAQDDLLAVKAYSHQVPQRGLFFDAARTNLTPATILFNYLGRFDTTLQPPLLGHSPLETGSDRSPLAKRRHLLEIDAMLLSDGLKMTWTFCSNHLKRAVVESVAMSFQTHLERLVRHCAQQQHRRLTPADFPLANLSQKELDQLDPKAQWIRDIYPLSPVQEGMLFLALYGERRAAYFEQLTCRFEGQLELESFQNAWLEMIQQTPALATAFAWEQLEAPLQIVSQNPSPAWHLEDLQQLIPEAQEAHLAEYLHQDRQRGFALDQAPLIRFALFQTGPSTWSFVWSYHHLLLDGWSMSLVLDEVLGHYRALVANQEFHRSKRLPFGRFIARTQEQCKLEATNFWRENLAGFQAPLVLPNQKNQSNQSSQGVGHVDRQFSSEVLSHLQSLGKSHGLTLSTCIQGAWALLLSRYCQTSDVVFGLTVSGREAADEDLTQTIGLLINTIPVRVQFEADQTLVAFLNHLQAQTMVREPHSSLPQAEIQACSSLEGGQELFDSLLVVENYPLNPDRLHQGLGFEISDVRAEAFTHYGLTVVARTHDGLHFQIAYDSGKFSHIAIERVLDQLHTILEAIPRALAQPKLAAKPRDISLLDDVTRQQLTHAWNQEQEYESIRQGIHQLFEVQAQAHPNRCALTLPTHTRLDGTPIEGMSLTYAQLNNAANHLAHDLIRRGAGPEKLVGLHVERSLEMVIGILGILKAGAAYVPLDPVYPSERLNFMVEDADLEWVICQQDMQEKLPTGTFEKITLKADTSMLEASPNPEPCSATPDQTAYIIYTSGSTGKPKGVPVTHRNVVRLFETSQSLFHFDASDSWTLFHSYAFDFTVWELWGAFIYGGRLVIVPQMVARSATSFHQLLYQENITVLNQTPSAFVRLIQADEQASSRLEALRYVIFGGEALEPQSLAPWFENYGDNKPQLINMYGITETTVHVTYGPITWVDCKQGGSNLGVRLPDLTLFLLDEQLQPVPQGVNGEIFVGGAGVARGYLHRPALTAQRFVPHPFAVKPGERLYRSGDLGRFRDDTLREIPILEYAGRCDFQVKIRGYRIELGEIEAVLLGVSGVRDAVVLAREDLKESGDKQLVAYLAGDLANMPSSEDMHQSLMKGLPDYMVPAHFVKLDSLPLTAHGKVDRAKLPTPGQVQSDDDVAYVAPRTPQEKQLADIWAGVLELEKVGIRQRFFELGGDSILSIRVMTAAKRVGLNFTLPQLFELQTIEKLAGVLSGEGTEIATRVSPFALVKQADQAKLPDALEDAYPATLLQKGMLFHSEKEKDAYHNLTSLHLAASYNEAFLREAIAHIITSHPVLRTSFDLSHFSEPLQLVHANLEVPIHFEDWRHLEASVQDAAFDAWFQAEKEAFFDWKQPGMFRFRVHRRSDASFQFTLTEHHAILDGWSVASLLTEIFSFYFARLEGREPQMPVLPNLGFADFVAMEQQTLSQGDSGRFWADHLDGFEFARIPRYPQRDADPAHLDVAIHSELSEHLLNLADSLGVSLKAMLLAVHYRVLALLTGSDDVLTGLVANGRPEEEGGERILGLFLNTLPLRYRMGDVTWAELVKDVFALEREALPHRRYPLAEIQKMFGGKAFFETAFNYTHFHVYQSIRQVEGLDLLGMEFYAPTHVPFAANFSKDLDSGDVLLSLDYRADTFSHKQVASIANYYLTALEHLVRFPNQNCRHIGFLSGTKRDKVLLDWNQTQVQRPATSSLHELVVQQADKTPEKTAIVALDREGNRYSLSFAELDEQASQLAHWLLAKGAQLDQPIALCMERSPQAIVAILAILKTGCAYVPLDPAYPDDRLAFMIEDSGATIAIAQQRHASRLEDWCLTVNLEEDATHIGSQPKTQPPVTIFPENAAYVIYTSGSTGTPKGVVISHRAILNQIYWRQQVFNLAEDDRMLQNLSLSFDPSVWQVFWPLSIGAQIYLIPNAAQRDIPWLAQLMLQHRLAAIAMVPSVLRVLLEEEAFLACDHLKHISCGGEGLPADLVSRFCEHFGEEGILHVVYGPTEATIDASTWTARKKVPTRIAPIGLPIHNAQLYVLDDAMEPVPPGVPGELYIAGEGLGRGYLNRSSLTSDRYVPNPFGEHGSRLYRSGDQVRFLENGLLEFLGRVDHQVKVRGFRIELGELEAILAEHPQIDEVACLVREDQPGDKRLAAYIHVNGEPDISPRRWMAERVPDYMVPAVFVTLDVFPRLPNDKINRQRLPKPDATDRQAEAVYTAPSTPVQDQLATIWAGVLDLERVGIHDNFFELGGDSILSLQIIARAREIGLAMSPKDLFENQTIAELAEVAGTLNLAKIDQGPVTGTVPLSPYQRHYLESASNKMSQHAILWRIPAQISEQHLSKALQTLANHHDSLRLSFVRDENHQWSQSYDPANLEIPLIHVTSQTEPSQWDAILEEHIQIVRAACHVGSSPLFRAVHCQFDPPQGMPEARLFLLAHELIADETSWRFILEDLQYLLASALKNEAATLPPKTHAYRTWTTQLQDQAQSNQAAFDQANRPQQRPRLLPVETSQNTVGLANAMSFSLDTARTQELLGQANHAFATRADELLITALGLAWKAWQGEDLFLDLYTANRPDPSVALDLSRTVGCFNTIYPVRTEVQPGHLDTAIKSVKQQLRSLSLQAPHPSLQTATSPSPQVSFRSKLAPIGDGFEDGFQVLKTASYSGDEPGATRTHVLEFEVGLDNGQARFELTWPPSALDKARIETLFTSFQACLVQVIDHCLNPDHGGRVPADFALVNLDQSQLDRLIGNGRGIEDVLPLAPTQQDILFHVVYREGALFHQQLHLVIEQELDIERFQQAWSFAIQRHMGLRSSFEWEGLEQPIQIVHRNIPLPWHFEDWRQKDREQQLQIYLNHDRRHPFDWSKAPLMRFGLFQLDDARYQFVWSHHFLLLDGWSSPLILKDVLAYYFNDSGKDQPLAHSFRDYLAWLGTQDLDSAKAWWRQSLLGFREPTPLPMDQLVCGEGGPATHGRINNQFSQADTARLVQFAKQQHLTVNTLVQGAWAMVLGYYAQTQDVLFGASVSGRPAEISGIEGMVGLFINTLPVRVQLDPECNVATWLHALQQAQQEREARSTTPALVIRGESDVAADQPLYESIVVFENFPVDPSLLDNRFHFSHWVVEEQTNFPLSLTVELNEPGLDLNLNYHTSRYQADLVARMLQHFMLILGQMEARYQDKLVDFQQQSGDQRQNLLTLGADRKTAEDTRCLHQLIEVSAQQTPNNTAIVAGDNSQARLTYAELDEAANALARHLQGFGIGPETYVGIFLHKCLDLPVAILAVLKTGAAFVPLSPEYPEERLASMASQADLVHLLTHRALQANLPINGVPVTCLDDPTLSWETKSPLDPCGHRDHPAYLIFSSGSTGKPKGITVSHGAIVNSALAWQADYQLRETCNVHLQMAAFSFDVFVGDFVRALTTSATLVLCPKEILMDPPALWQLIEREQVDIAEFVPAVMRELATHLETEGRNLAQFRVLIVGSDAWSMQERARIKNLSGPQTRLINSYGVTEASVDSTYLEHTQLRLTPERMVPIGRPYHNNRVFVLNRQLDVVAMGITGLLFLGGASLARGYHRNARATAEKFIPHPYGKPGERLYRTDDSARILPDGQLDFLGRIDHQIKLRGLRIELGEIEATLVGCDSVQQAVVILREDGPKNLGPQLVGYCVTDSSWEEDSVRSVLKRQLPDYMVPSFLMPLESLPLAPNGKVDRRHLPAPAWDQFNFGRTEPQTETEQLLVTLWAKTLGHDIPSMEANFFQLGGHSLLATRLISYIRQTFQVDLPLRVLFENPTIDQMGQAIDMALTTSSELGPTLVKSEAEPILSHGQTRLWFIEKMADASAAYNLSFGLHLRGELHRDHLQAAILGIIDRHESLRTSFSERDGRPLLVIHETPSAFEIPYIDLVHALDPNADAKNLFDQESRKVFDLENGPLWRFRLARTGPDEHMFMITMHHIISDAWSIGVMVTELSHQYGARLSGHLPQLPELALQYSDFAHWQKAYLQEGRMAKQLTWWQEQLRDAPPALDLPFDRPRSPQRQIAGASFDFALDRVLTSKIKALAEETGTTLFMNLIGAYAVLLGRYSRSDDVVIGTPIANRARAELEPMIGFFVNTLALRFKMGHSSWRDHLAKIRDMTLQAYAHQDLPFERLVEALEIPRNLSHEPVFQVMFTLQTAFNETLKLPGLQVEAKRPSTQEARYEIMLVLEEGPDGIHGFWEYNCDLFNRETVAQMAENYRQLLEQLATLPDQPLNSVHFTSSAQKTQLITNFHHQLAAQPKADSIQAMVESQAMRTPQLPAVIEGQTTLSYKALNQKANRLAHTLREKGVGLETPVAIVAKRSTQTIIGQLAILKAGGTYLPLDPQLPDARLKFMLADTQPQWLLGLKEDLDRFADFGLSSLLLDDPASWHQTDDNLPERVMPDSSAYVMYTSGSTGQPKGVTLTHRCVVSLVEAPDYVQIHSGDRVLHAASLAFDATTFEVWAPLVHGAAVCVFPQGPMDSRELTEFINRHQISSVFLTSGLFNRLVEESVESLQSVRYLMTGGQALSSPHAGKFMKALPDCILSNIYGPTECTTFSTNHPLSSGDLSGRAPIGDGIHQRATVVLDRAFNLTAPNIIGELFIAGPGLARGYLNQPALTAKSFIPNPYGSTPGSRLYATGDLVYRDSDGHLIFCGREDDQVKIRGYRIEIGEIEAQLNQHDEMVQAAVLPRTDLPGGEALVAFVQLERNADHLDASQLSAFLKQTLPDFMVPALFVPLDTMPLNQNGKVDRKALGRMPVTDRLSGQSEQVLPRTATEKRMAKIWSEILETDQLSIHDNFFEVGGHSLLATQVVSRIRASYGLETPLAQFFEKPTIAQLAQWIESEKTGHNPAGMNTDVFELTRAQQQIWLLDKLNTGQSTPLAVNNRCSIYQVDGPLDVAALQSALSALELRQQSLRGHVCSHQGQPFLVIHPTSRVQITHVDVSNLDQVELEKMIHQEGATEFHLENGPLWRFTLMRRNAESWLLVVTFHRIIADAPSRFIFFSDLLALYGEALGLESASLEPLSMTFTDHVTRLQDEDKQSRDEVQAVWWQEKLADIPMDYPLPNERPRAPFPSYRSDHLQTHLDGPATQQLEAMANSAETSMGNLLLAGLKVLLSQFSGQTDILVATPTSGRHNTALKPMIGYLANTLVLRSQLEPSNSFQELLAQLKQTAIDAAAHQDVPFEKVVDALPNRQRRLAPLCPTRFVMETDECPSLEMGSVRLKPLNQEPQPTVFDLTLKAQRRDSGMTLTWTYHRDLFNPATIHAMATHFTGLLDAIPQHGNQPIADLGISDRAEFTQQLEALTQTPTAPQHQELFQQEPFTAPRNDIETQLMEIWQDVLGQENISVHDNFFDIGGHLLLAAQIHWRINEIFPETLSLQFFFEEPTIAGLAQTLESIRSITLQPDMEIEEDELEAFEF